MEADKIQQHFEHIQNMQTYYRENRIVSELEEDERTFALFCPSKLLNKSPASLQEMNPVQSRTSDGVGGEIHENSPYPN